MFCEKCVTHETIIQQKNRKEISREQLLLDFINGPLKSYLTGDISYGKFKELINETCGTEFAYSDIYPSYLFNARINYEESDRLLLEDLGSIK